MPWNALSSKPVQLEIQGLQLLVQPLERGDGNKEWLKFVEEHNRFENLEQALTDYCLKTFQKMMTRLQSTQNSEEQSGYLMNLTSKIVDNVQVSIKNIHVRYEDPFNLLRPLSFGLTLQKLDIDTTNELWQPEFFDRTNP